MISGVLRGLILSLLVSSSSVIADTPMPTATAHVATVKLEGPIGPASAEFFYGALDRAHADGAQALVLEIDTPGGLATAMRDIIKHILSAPMPVIGYVSPAGARAASAGTYILYACHVAAMAPSTNLGAATPIPVGGGMPAVPKPASERQKDSEEQTLDPATAAQAKIVNDAVAFLRSLAERRGRNADWAEEAVRSGASLSAQAALENKVIDLIAPNVPALLQQIDGKMIELALGNAQLSTAKATVVEILPDWRERLLMVLSNPTLAYGLLLVGLYGLLLEGYNPGALVPGVTGVICLLLALFAFQVLPVNYAGLALIFAGLVMIVAEAFMPSFGVLGLGGIIAFVFGSVILMDSDVPGYQINVGLIAGTAASAALLTAMTVWLFSRSRRQPVTTGAEQLLHSHGEIDQSCEFAWVQGERWRVRSHSELRPGNHIRVTGIDGLTLLVEPENEFSEG